MRNWIYPLSSRSEHWFGGLPARYDDTGPDAFRYLVEHSNGDDWWHLTTGFRQIDERDRVWCYYGRADGDLGVYGLAQVGGIDHDERRGGHCVWMRWQVPACRRLWKTPVSAPVVRRHLPRPRRAVLAIDAHRQLVRTLERAAGV